MRTNLNEELMKLFLKIEKRIKEGNKYEEVNLLIKDFVDNKKNNNSENINLARDINESLRILNMAYDNNSKNDNFNKFLSEKEKMTNRQLEKYHLEKKEKNKIDKDLSEEEEDENYDNKSVNDFEIINTSLELIIEESKEIQKLLIENEIKEEAMKINELNNDISNAIVVANKLMQNKTLINDESIKSFHEEIKTIRKEYDKIYKKKKYTEVYSKSKMQRK